MTCLIEEEVVHFRNSEVVSIIHPSVHPSIHLFMRSFTFIHVHSFIRSCQFKSIQFKLIQFDSIHYIIHSAIHWFISAGLFLLKQFHAFICVTSCPLCTDSCISLLPPALAPQQSCHVIAYTYAAHKYSNHWCFSYSHFWFSNIRPGLLGTTLTAILSMTH